MFLINGGIPKTESHMESARSFTFLAIIPAAWNMYFYVLFKKKTQKKQKEVRERLGFVSVCLQSEKKLCRFLKKKKYLYIRWDISIV